MGLTIYMHYSSQINLEKLTVVEGIYQISFSVFATFHTTKLHNLFNMSEKTTEPKIPSELRISRTWEICAERAVVDTTIGTAVGGLASLVLFRKISFY